MYSESDIEAAVASGAITPQAAAALRNSVASSRAAPAVDEESFRLITGFNDIFVTIAAMLLLVAVGWIGSALGGAIVAAPFMLDYTDPVEVAQMQRHIAAGATVAGLAVAAVSWLLAEYFTRKRRMALPSIFLLLTFALGVGGAIAGLLGAASSTLDARHQALVSAMAALVTAGATYAHWRRFHVPITIAALTCALAATLVSLVMAAIPATREAWLFVLMLAGLAIFSFAMWWDVSDRQRQTRRSDVAFWLHLVAAPMIAHPVFNLLGVTADRVGIVTGLAVILLYILFGIVALAVDRRALLVSSLFYVLFALASLFESVGAVSLNIALTALVIGSALLLLSAFWHGARRLVVTRLSPALRDRLPVLDRPLLVTPRPA
ncbi:hypothetical protein [uncultured Sphingomonas sp.]|uniref:hypothetical protein n=1 Tax=uncultured Sphingomonas sp. TaxID=158754 RepID=UPI0025FB09C7|nr:hypothetical protein [uncultured Sphingomonas sp.]